MSWETENEGPRWAAILENIEVKYQIPRGLLARVAYQESRFRDDIISGATKSSVRAIGIMQLMPQYFPHAGENAASDIDEAGRFLANLHARFGDWQLALAAYNWGPGNVHRCLENGGGLSELPEETRNYVEQIHKDVPVTGSLV